MLCQWCQIEHPEIPPITCTNCSGEGCYNFFGEHTECDRCVGTGLILQYEKHIGHHKQLDFSRWCEDCAEWRPGFRKQDSRSHDGRAGSN